MQTFFFQNLLSFLNRNFRTIRFQLNIFSIVNYVSKEKNWLFEKLKQSSSYTQLFLSKNQIGDKTNMDKIQFLPKLYEKGLFCMYDMFSLNN